SGPPGGPRGDSSTAIFMAGSSQAILGPHGRHQDMYLDDTHKGREGSTWCAFGIVHTPVPWGRRMVHNPVLTVQVDHYIQGPGINIRLLDRRA
ncbi:MAG: hypothetical protein M3R38_14440, partial [Actinomycetota bacterium]|nr:hypothetical protein [Actinomycetota bacterium]